MAIQQAHLAYAATMFASSAINNLFVTYYLEIFIYVVNISPGWFYAGQIIFMLWNAINDPLFGWLSDTFGMSSTRGKFLQNPQARRLFIIQYGGAAWCLAFVLVWFAPGPNVAAWIKGVHFTLALCLYDGALSLVEVNHSALLADMTTSSGERAHFNASAGVLGAVGSLSSLVGHALFNRSDLTAFRAFTICVALISFAAFTFTARTLSTCSVLLNENEDDNDNDNQQNEVPLLVATHSVNNECKEHHMPHCSTCTYTGPGVSPTAIARTASSHTQSRVASSPSPSNTSIVNRKEGDKRPSVILLIKNLLSQRNFMVFMCVYFLQAFDCTFEKNHFSIFLVGLSDGIISPVWQSIIVSASFALPWVCTVLLTPSVQRHGVHTVVRYIFLVRLLVCIASASLSGGGALFCSVFLLVNRVLSECVCRLCPLIISDLVDEDRFLRQRQFSLSASVVGFSTFFGKFAQSLAPMLGFTILRQSFPGSSSSSGLISASLPLSWLTSGFSAGGDDEDKKAHKAVLNVLLVGVPMVCVVIQYALWAQFTLHGSYLKRVKLYCSPLFKNKLNP